MNRRWKGWSYVGGAIGFGAGWLLSTLVLCDSG